MLSSVDAELLVMQLQRYATGANAHTAGKAQFYLRRIAGKPNAAFSTCTADEFVAAVRNAVNGGNWNELSNVMRRWW